VEHRRAGRWHVRRDPVFREDPPLSWGLREEHLQHDDVLQVPHLR
jgi:hypothetical protein